MQAVTQNRITQGQHGTSKAVDYSASPDKTLYAPEDGVIDSYMQRGSGTSNAGLALRMRGANGLHQFAHTERSLVKVGQSVKRGQPIAIMGYTGYTIPSGPAGAHVHWWIQRSNGTYVYPPSIINEAFIKGGDMPDKVNIGTARILAESVLGRDRGATHAGQGDGDLNTHHVGQNLTNDYIYKLWTSAEAGAYENYQATVESFYRTYKDQIAELSTRPTKAQLEALGQALQAEQAKVAEAEKALEEAKKQGGGISPEDSAAIKETNNIIKQMWEAFKSIFRTGDK